MRVATLASNSAFVPLLITTRQGMGLRQGLGSDAGYRQTGTYAIAVN